MFWPRTSTSSSWLMLFVHWTFDLLVRKTSEKEKYAKMAESLRLYSLLYYAKDQRQGFTNIYLKYLVLLNSKGNYIKIANIKVVRKFYANVRKSKIELSAAMSLIKYHIWSLIMIKQRSEQNGKVFASHLLVHHSSYMKS